MIRFRFDFYFNVPFETMKLKRVATIQLKKFTHNRDDFVSGNIGSVEFFDFSSEKIH